MMIVSSVVNQHVDDAASLASRRVLLVTSPSARVLQLLRFDHRLAANLDGMRIAGKHVWKFMDAAFGTPSPGVIFAAAVRAIEDRDEIRLARIFLLAAAEPYAKLGLLAAFAWVDRARLQGMVAALLNHPDAFRRMVGIAACAAHGIDPGIAASNRIQDGDPAVRARALRAAGELGIHQLVSTIAAAIGDDDVDCQFWAAWSAVLLGDRQSALEKIAERAVSPGVNRQQCFRLALQAMRPNDAHATLKELARDAEQQRWIIQGSGIVGDPAYVPWLIDLMNEPEKARLAGEAFTLITGVNLGLQALDRPAPQAVTGGPNGDPEDSNVDMDPDDGLPWPEADRVGNWWAAHSGRFVSGLRYFMGGPVTRDRCLEVLRRGTQRQRILAACHMCLLEPGTPLFNTSAPAWRQQHLLEQVA